MTPSELNDVLVAMIESVVSSLLPGGKRQANEWLVGSVAGEPGQSLRVCMSGTKAGVWKDFSSDNSGGDLIDLWAAVKGVSLKSAISQAGEYAGVDMGEKIFYPDKIKTYQKPDKKNIVKADDKIYEWFKKRGISKETVILFKISLKGKDIVFPYIFDGEAEHLKFRNMDEKKFFASTGTAPCLFGWQAVDDNARFVVLTEGEIDAMTYRERGIPALSVPAGGGNGNKQQWIEYEYDRLERFDCIYLSMDNDATGESAKQEIISRLGRHRCKVIELPYKDANEVLMSGITFSFDEALKDAKTLDPDELCQLSSFHGKIMEEFYPPEGKDKGLLLPWRKTHSEVRLLPGDITVWAGINSHGKSVLLSHIVVDGVAQGYKFCIASMEMQPHKLGRKMYQQIGGIETPDIQYAEEMKKFVHNGVWIFNAYGTAKSKTIMEVFDYARRKYGVSHFIVDSLAKCGFGEDDYNGQKDFVDALMEFAGKNNVHTHLVVHIRKKEDENKIPGKMDIKGTGAISDMVDNVFIAWRNKPKEDDMRSDDFVRIEKSKDKPDAVLSCEKQRETGQEPSFGLWWHGKSCQFLEYSSSQPKRYIFT